MRAQIVYTVDIGEIPNEVERLRQKTEDLLSETLTTIKDLNIDASATAAIDGFESLSAELVTIDLLLRDCSAILQGYLASKVDPAFKHAQSPMVEEKT